MRPLTGIRVLDLTHLLPGPYGTMILADHGADVIKIERPRSGDTIRQLAGDIPGVSEIHACINRGKRSVTLDLGTETGQSLFHRLLENADVLVEGFRPGVMQRLGLDFASLQDRYSKLIYCSISGYGQNGSKRHVAGHDLNFVGEAGLLSIAPDGSQSGAMPPTLLADLHAGLCAALGIVLAVQERGLTGQGRYLDVTMTRAVSSFLLPGAQSPDVAAGGEREGKPWYSGGLACYNVYPTEDGKFITLAAIEDQFWRQFCAIVGRPDLADGHLKVEKQPMLRREVAEIIASEGEEYWLDVSRRYDVCIGPVRPRAAAMADCRLRDPGWPSPFPSSGPPPRGAPELGADTRDILVDELGMAADEFERGQERGAC